LTAEKGKLTFHDTRKFTSSSSPSTRIIIEVSISCDWHLHCAIKATYLYDGPMIRIETSERGDFVTFVLRDWIQKEDLGVLKSLVDKQKKAVVLDLKGVKLVDQDAVRFLASFETGQAKITNCPRYIREWVRRERAQP
jgi:hypothetical protein